ncbi:F-box domain, cyclin-like protein [Akanthomyces lecanii RCEF 1005]|uniref:F-box domain, cyclin-like protein n=1 Tax=Akanthomyces lecanii RCEF 1005 TaxID=1081108 RepID=A0A162K9F2_CORDF|nr:F-box domain, cyclin-like protein [Akanthomyces lecanii RCEF 1005]
MEPNDSAAAESPNETVILLRLPPELLENISALLPNSDIKSLRQACSGLCKLVHLRLTRVFLSPDPRNIKVFRAIAEHDDHRHAIREIIYDDARLKTSWLTTHLRTDEQQQSPGTATEEDEEELTPWERYRLRTEPPRSACAPSAAPSTGSARLRAVESGADEAALAYGLARFPNLARVTVTPAAHGFLHAPLYQTPMIRALPAGFNYAVPRGWPCVALASLADTSAWVPDADTTPAQVAAVRSCWRGLRLVLRQLAEEIEVQRQQLVVPELVMDVHGLNTGLNPHMFAQATTPDYAHLQTILAQPGFRRLDLPLMLGGLVVERWACLANGFFRGLLAKARDLEHFRLAGDAEEGPSATVPAGSTKHCPLARVLPVSRWKRLRHFGLYRIPVQVNDLLAVLTSLPESLRSVELSFLLFADKDATGYRGLLEEMRTRLRWHERQSVYRPKVLIGLPVMGAKQPGRGIWLGKEISAFLYGDGPNPFATSASVATYGMGVMKDEFEPEYERPHVDHAEMVRLGYHAPLAGDDQDQPAA